TRLQRCPFALEPGGTTDGTASLNSPSSRTARHHSGPPCPYDETSAVIPEAALHSGPPVQQESTALSLRNAACGLRGSPSRNFLSSVYWFSSDRLPSAGGSLSTQPTSKSATCAFTSGRISINA